MTWALTLVATGCYALCCKLPVQNALLHSKHYTQIYSQHHDWSNLGLLNVESTGNFGQLLLCYGVRLRTVGTLITPLLSD